jgi:hypothetical protein
MADGDVTVYELTNDLDAKAVAARKDELVTVDRELDRQKDEKRQAIVEFNEAIKPLAKRRTELLEAIENQREVLDVECVESWDYKTNRVVFKRKDTGEEVDERAMEASERQEELGNVEGGKNKRGRRGKKS